MSEIDKRLLISVIIPTYNRADLIPRAIASVTKQTYQHLEIIIVDDASEDNIASVVQSIKDSRIKYIRHQTNLGGSEARNTGIKNAQGKYIAFLDSDDVWLPDKLKLQLAAVSQQENQENLVCYGRFQISPRVFYKTSVFPARAKQENETVPDYFWLFRGEVLTSTLLISRTLAVVTMFKPGLAKHQDLDFVIRLEKQGAKFIFVPQILAIWHNEARSDRISKKANYQISLNWIEQYREQISERAYQGFLLKEIVPKMILESEQKSTVASLIFRAWQNDVVSLSSSLALLIKLVIPRKYQQQIKNLFKPTTIGYH
ncbi:glycosyltransferase family 2 protein [Pleurocapsa sp. PCC 7319]|uniref:glycosyltransferase family 2 protein n=1 Tax=Pleurocapsa sp. PCC 7319 TaxID=118161 RepID=UPI000349E552|nr:glycosyltransferase family 2 protein [Pleurocapsa sp. PCC 7319]